VRSILIATWGKPSAWSLVSYRLGDKVERSHSTLPALLSHSDPRPERAVLIVLDTVVERRFSSYGELEDSVRSSYLEFVREEVNVGLSCLDVVVAPGVGRFKLDGGGYARFNGSLSDFYAYVLFRLSGALLNLLDGDGEAVVHLDLSHGINFMPSLTLAALRELLGAMALAEDVRLKVYNSEPYTKGVEELAIHLVEDERILPALDARPLGARGECALLKARVESPEAREALRRARLSRGEAAELNAFLSSIVNGLPLALYTFCPDARGLMERLDEALELWRRMVVVARRGDEVVVEGRLAFADDFARLAVLSFAAAALRLSRRREVALDELDELRRRLFSRLSRKLDCMVSFDLDDVKGRAAGGARRAAGRWIRLHEALGEAGGFDPRNFLAHSGLEKNVVELRAEGPSIKVRYADSELERVADACLKGLPKR